MTTDFELLDRWCAGDQRAGNTLFERHFSSICRFFQNKLQDHVEELVQQTFLACVQNRDSFRKQSSFRTYLFSIARFQLYHHLRKKAGKGVDVQVTSIADLGVSPRSHAVKKQERELLLQALCTLPVEQQVLLELFYWEGMDTPELAEVLDIPAATVRTRLFRARSALRERMEALADAPSSIKTSVEDLDAWARSLRNRDSGDSEGSEDL